MSTPAEVNRQRLAELEQQYGRVAHIEVEDTLFAFRPPDLDEWEDYQDSLSKKRRGVCFREFAQVTLVHPGLDELKALFNRMPAIATRIADAVSDLAGADIELTVKKE